MLTLRQIEVVRAIFVSGSILGAAKMLNVSAPGISRLLKYTEGALKVRLFQRSNGRFIPTPEARDIFEQIDSVYQKLDDLSYVLGKMQSGASSELKIGSVPSISHVMVPRAVARVRSRYPDLRFDINVLKIEEAVDYLLLGRGEVVAISSKIDHPSLIFQPLSKGELYCIVPQNHLLSRRSSISASEMTKYPLIGIDPKDPYGRIMADTFDMNGLNYDITIRARFGTTVCALVKAGLGIAVIDQFTVAHGEFPGISILKIEEPTIFETYIATKRGTELSLYAQDFISNLRLEMNHSKPIDRGNQE